MFSKLIDKRSLQNGKLIFVITTLVLWGLQLAFLSIMLHSVKFYLHHIIGEELQSSITLFLQILKMPAEDIVRHCLKFLSQPI